MLIDGFLDRRHQYLEHVPAAFQRKKTGTFLTNAITQKDHAQQGSNVALPDAQHVKEARDWVNFNQK